MLYHPGLSDTDIIRNTVEPNHFRFAIIHGVTGTRVTIPGLSDAPGINNQSAPAQDKPDINPERVKGTATSFSILEYRRHMRMTYQAKW